MAERKITDSVDQHRRNLRCSGSCPLKVADIARSDVIEVLRPIWKTKTETASRLRGRLETIFDWCIRHGLRTAENPARWRGGLEFDLPSEAKIQVVQHHEAPTLPEIRAIVPKMLSCTGGRAILFGILTASRVQEFLGARWDEIDFKRKIWNVPPERRKDGKKEPHRVPLYRNV